MQGVVHFQRLRHGRPLFFDILSRVVISLCHWSQVASIPACSIHSTCHIIPTIHDTAQGGLWRLTVFLITRHSSWTLQVWTLQVSISLRKTMSLRLTQLKLTQMAARSLLWTPWTQRQHRVQTIGGCSADPAWTMTCHCADQTQRRMKARSWSAKSTNLLIV